MSQLPERGRTMDLALEGEDDEDREIVAKVQVLAIDEQEGVWTCKDMETGELLLMTFDENGNWNELECVVTPVDETNG